MSIKLNELSAETQAKFREAIADGRITAEEWKNFSVEEQQTLSAGLGGKVPTVGDDIVIKITKTIQPKEASKQERAKLSWGEIGKQALKSTGNFFKGMVCDEKGFSLTKTATTLAVGLAFGAVAAVSAPVALAAGAVMGGYMVYNGGKNLIEGTEAYYNAKTHEEAAAAMEKAMDGGVETTMGVAALFGVKKGYSKLKSTKAQTRVTSQPEQAAPKAEPKLEPRTDIKEYPEVDGVSVKKATFRNEYGEQVNSQRQLSSMDYAGRAITEVEHANYPGMRIRIKEVNGQLEADIVNLQNGKTTPLSNDYAAELLRKTNANEDMGILFRFINANSDYSSYSQIFKK